MLELAQQLSYYLSVVDGGATSKLVSFGQELASVGMIAMSVRASVASALAPMQQVASAWSGREQQINNISRSLRQYEVVGESIAAINERINRSMANAPVAERAAAQSAAYRQQFGEARQFARGIIQQMSQDAAILPGEMNDYAASFALFYPAAMGAASRRVHGQLQSRTLGEILRTSNYLTAGAIAAGVDAPQASRDIMGMMQGVAGLDNRTWREVVKNYATLNGRRITDASQFNRLRGDQRFDVLMDVAQRLQPLMDATGDAYEAIVGTFNSLKHELFLSITEPVYESLKHILSATTGQMARLFPLIQNLASRALLPVTRGMEKFVQMIPKIADKLEGWLGALPGKISDVTTRMWSLFAAGRFSANNAIRRFFGDMPAFASHSTHVNAGMAAVFGVPMATLLQQLGHGLRLVFVNTLPIILLRNFEVALGPVGYLLVSLFTRVLTTGQAGFGSALQNAAALFGQLVAVLAPIVLLFDGFMNMLAIGVAAVLPMVFMFFDMISNVIGGVLLPIFSLFQAAFMGALFLLIPALFGFAVGIQAIFAIIKGIILLTVASFLHLFGLGDRMPRFTTDITNFAETLRRMTRAAQQWWTELGESINYLKLQLHLISAEDYNRQMRTTGEGSYIRGVLDNTAAGLDEIQRRTQRFDPNRRGRPENNRPQVHQDFRYSRFDITQKFAEGFSPERVGAAFTSDLEAMANQRLSSGLAPAFTSG